jgi:hypothetical protein
MRLHHFLIPLGLLLIYLQPHLSAAAHAQDALPIVDKGEVAPLLANCEHLLKAAALVRAPLPQATRRALQEIIKAGPQDATALEKVQKLLDPYCLVGVNINPESRVKAARGPAAANLVQYQDTVFLVKVHNEAGVTQRLTLTSPHLLGGEGGESDRWLSATVYAKPPLREKLSGHEVEYVILVLSSRIAGKREAKFIFDVGQGTQDLGFRAEVPILFTIKPPSP